MEGLVNMMEETVLKKIDELWRRQMDVNVRSATRHSDICA